MHHGAPSEVQILAKESAAPDHVGQRCVNHQQPDRAEQAPKAKAQALHQCPGDQGGGDDREHALEQGKRQSGNGESTPGAGKVVQQCVLEGMANAFMAPPSAKARLKPMLVQTSVAIPIITRLMPMVLSTLRP